MLDVAGQQNAGETEEEDQKRGGLAFEGNGEEQQERAGQQDVERLQRRAGHSDAQKERRNSYRTELRHGGMLLRPESGARRAVSQEKQGVALAGW